MFLETQATQFDIPNIGKLNQLMENETCDLPIISPNLKKCLDATSYGCLGSDSAVFFHDLENLTAHRVAFIGPSGKFMGAEWLNDNTFLIVEHIEKETKKTELIIIIYNLHKNQTAYFLGPTINQKIDELTIPYDGTRCDL